MTLSPEIRAIFNELGLNKSEIDAYATSFSYKKGLTSGTIANRADLKNSTCTMALQALIKKGAATLYKQGSNTFYVAEPLEKLVSNYVRKKERAIADIKHKESTLVEYMSEQQVCVENSPVVKMYEGYRNIDEFLYFLLQNTKNMDIYIHSHVENNEKIYNFWKKILVDISKKQIRANIVVNSKGVLKQLQKDIENLSLLHQSIVSDKINNTSEKIICDSCITHISWNCSIPTAICVEDKNIAHSEKKIFRHFLFETPIDL